MKKREYKRICALMLSGVMAASMLAGCGAEKEASAPAASAEAGQETENAAKTEEAQEAKGEKLLAEELTIELLQPENAYAPISEDCAVLREIFEKTNVHLKIKAVPSSDYGTKASMYMATNKIPDAMEVGTGNIKDYARSGMFLNLSEYEEYMPNYLAALNTPERKMDAKSLYLDGNLYSFANLEKFRIGTATMPLIRADLLEEQNLPMPTTWDEFYDVMLKIKEKHPDMYAMSSRMGTNYLLGQLAFPLGTGGFEEFKTNNGMYYEPDQDKYLYGPIQDDFKLVLEFVHNMYADGLLDPDYAVMTRDICWEKLSSGKLFAYYDNNTFAARTFNPALRELDPNARFEMIPPMENSEGETRSLRYQRDWLGANIVISSQVERPELRELDPNARFEMIPPMENSEGETRSLRYQRDWLGANIVISSQVERPEDVVKFFDWMYSEEGANVCNFGIEGETYDMVDGEPIINPDLLAKHSSSDDVIASIQAEIGAGSNNFTPYIDESWFKQTADPEMVEMGAEIDEWTKEGKTMHVRNSLELLYTEEDVEKLKTLEANVITLFNQEIDKFITGQRPLSEWDGFADELAAAGATEIEEIYNRAYDKMKAE